MNRRAPWWLTWVLAGGLALVFLGERVLAGLTAARLLFSIAGAVLVVGSLVWRSLAWRDARATGAAERARVEGQLLLSYAGCTLALLLYFLSSDAGISLLHVDFADEAARGRYRTVLDVLWSIALAVSLLPALGAQFGLGSRRSGSEQEADGLEAARIGEHATAGLVVALAGSLLFVLGFVATRNDKSADLGYFRTSSPGTATRALARSLRHPLQVFIFFPKVNPVAQQIEDYFRALDRAGGRLTVEEHDRLAEPALAQKYDVRQDGTVLMLSGQQAQRIYVPVEMEIARPGLRRFDKDVQTRLAQLVRGARVAYFTIGHGELNDSAFAASTLPGGLGGVEALKELLHLLNYRVQNLGLTGAGMDQELPPGDSVARGGLAQDVPADASIVLVLGPQRAFLPEELAALDRYVARGGSVLLALQPGSPFRLGPLEQRLGLRYNGLPLADDKQYVRRRDDISDHALLVTDRFSTHPAVITAGGAGPGAAALFPDAGYLEPIDSSKVHPQFLVRTLPTTFVDRNRDFQAEEPAEKRGEYNLGAAVQADSGRALVYADAEMFTDPVLSSLRVNASLVADGVHWLGREEALAGTTESEEDVPIQHTRAQDVAWFYSTILGAPALLLGLGLFGVRRHRRRGRRS